jgi:phenylpyruvate tautomerase PptA (4-oxalocrotonate tautomerase family)
MPLINIFTSASPTPEKVSLLLRTLSHTLSRELGKPESYVMTCLVPQSRMTFGGNDTPACYVEVKNIGELAPELTERLSTILSSILTEGLGVSEQRTYIEFSIPPPHLFGFAGKTFA